LRAEGSNELVLEVQVTGEERLLPAEPAQSGSDVRPLRDVVQARHPRAMRDGEEMPSQVGDATHRLDGDPGQVVAPEESHLLEGAPVTRSLDEDHDLVHDASVSWRRSFVR